MVKALPSSRDQSHDIIPSQRRTIQLVFFTLFPCNIENTVTVSERASHLLTQNQLPAKLIGHLSGKLSTQTSCQLLTQSHKMENAGYVAPPQHISRDDQIKSLGGAGDFDPTGSPNTLADGGV